MDDSDERGHETSGKNWRTANDPWSSLDDTSAQLGEDRPIGGEGKDAAGRTPITVYRVGFHRGVEGKSGSQGIGSRRQTGRVTSRCRSIGDRPSNETEHASHKLSPCLARVKAGFVTLCTQPGRLGPGLIPSADALLSFRLGIHPRDRVPSSVFSSRCLTLPFPPSASLSILLPGCHPSTRYASLSSSARSSESSARTVFHRLATCPLYPDPDISRARNPESASVIDDPARQ